MLTTTPALCRSIGNALRDAVLPQLTDPYARSQVAAAIYVLANLERHAREPESQVAGRTDGIVAATRAVRDASQRLGLELPEPPSVFMEGGGIAPSPEEADEALCALLDALAKLRRSDDAPVGDIHGLESRLVAAAAKAMEEEKRLVAPSMMREMSGENE